MDDCIVRQHRNNRTAHPHAATELLVAHHAVSLIRDRHMPVSSALASFLIVAQMQSRRYGNALGLAQASNHAGLVHEAVDCPYASAEVGLEIADGDVIWDQAERGRRWQARAMLGEEIESWR